MPIRFRCPFCNRLLGIATRKAGTDTTCPHCGCSITVPVPEEDNGRTERVNLDDVDALLGNAATQTVPQSAVAAPPRPPAPKVRSAPAPDAPPVPAPSDEPPLFEGDMDAILGSTKPPAEPERAKPVAVSGADAMSLGEPAGPIVISAQKATLLMLLVVVLMALSFAAGFMLKG